MRELDVNTQQKNLIEQDKLQHELFKLSRSGRRATNQITKEKGSVADHFLDVTCKTDVVTERRKQEYFHIMKVGRARPATAIDKASAKHSTTPRPASAVHYIPSSEATEEKQVYVDKLGRPDIERIHRERLDKFYHHKIDKMMAMMEERNAKRRSKSAPISREQLYDVNNLPDTIPETRPISRSDAEFQLKKMRASLQNKKPSMLYGEIKEDTVVKKKYNPDRVPPMRRAPSSQDFYRRGSSAQDRRGSSAQERRGSIAQDRRPSTAQDRRASSDRRASVMSSSSQDRTAPLPDRRGSMALARRTSFKPPVGDSDVSNMSDSDDEVITRPKFRRQPLRPNYQSSPLDSVGMKMKDFQDKKYPSRFLDPNPDCFSRIKPFPVILDKKAYDAFCRRVARVKTTSQMKRDLEELISRSEERDEKEVWEEGYVRKQPKQAWGADRGHRQSAIKASWDSGPRF